MSKEVDQRVVEMQFDNKQFESGVSTTMKSLDSLKKGLNFDESCKSLNKLEQTGRSFSLASIGNGLEGIASRFTNLGIVGVTALQNITNSAVNAGKRIVSALTIDPIKTGFSEYELKMGSIQTIMAGTGESLQTVNKYLDELNLYADRTIYSFADMTSNIGKFTNAGVKLPDAVAAIKGVSNEAAVSGANAQEASRAMYNFAQALSAGYVKLIDWKSIENANMATVEFKNNLIQTAVAQGKLTKTTDGMYKTLEKGTIIDATHNFNDSLQEQWMTTDVLVKTLHDYADETTEIGKKAYASAQDVKTFSQLFDTLKEAAQSGWTESWELIVGDFEEAKKFLTDLSTKIGGILDASSQARNNFISGWKAVGGRTQMIEALTAGFDNLMLVMDKVSEAASEVFPKFTGVQLAGLTKEFANFVKTMKPSEETLEKVKTTFKGVFAVFDIGRQIIEGAVKTIKDVVKAIFPSVDGLLSISASLGDFLVGVDETIKKSGAITSVFKVISTVVSSLAAGISGVLKGIGMIFNAVRKINLGNLGKIKNLTGDIKPMETVGEHINSIFNSIISTFAKAAPAFGQVADWIGKAFTSITTYISNAFSDQTFNSAIDALNGGLFAGLLVSLNKFINNFGDIFKGLGDKAKDAVGIKDLLDGVQGSLEAYQSRLKADILIKIATAIGILAGSLLVLSLIDSNKLTTALAAITALFIELFGSMSAFEAIMGKKGFQTLSKVTNAMLVLSVAILILSFALKNLAELDWGGLARGITGITVLIGELVGAVELLGKDKGKLMKGAGQLVILSVAILILSIAVEKISKLDWGGLAKGLIAVGVLMGALLGFVTLLNNAGFGIGTGLALIGVATAVFILATAMMMLAGLDADGIVAGLMAIGGVLLEIWIFVQIMPEGILGTAAALVVISAALLIMAVALRVLGSMSPEEVGMALLMLAGSLAAIAIAVNFMTSALPGAAALLVVAIALGVLAIAMKIFGSISLEQIATGLLALVGTLVVIGGMSLLLAPAAAAIAALGGALLILGIAVLAIGGGLMLLATALGILAVSGAAGITALTAIVTALASLIPMIVQKIGELIVAVANAVGDGAVAIGDAVIKIVDTICKVLTDCVPKLVETVGVVLTALAAGMVGSVATLTEAGVAVVTAIISGIAAGFSKGDKSVVTNGVKSMSNDMVSTVNNRKSDFEASGTALMTSFADGVTSGEQKVKTSANEAANKAITQMDSKKSDFYNVGLNAVKGFANGIKDNIKLATDAAAKMATDAHNAACGAIEVNSPSKAFAETGMYAVMGLANGLKKYAYLASDASSDMSAATLQPVMDMQSSLLASRGILDKTLKNVATDPVSIAPVVKEQQTVVMKHEFGDLHVEGTNDKGEFVASADYAVEGLLADIMRRQNRR